MLQSIAVYCSLLQSIAVYCSLLQSIAVYCSLLQSIAVFGSAVAFFARLAPKMLKQSREIKSFRNLLIASRFAIVGKLSARIFIRAGDGRVLYWISTITRVSKNLCSRGALEFRV